MKTQGRQYRFLFLFILAAGLILPAICLAVRYAVIFGNEYARYAGNLKNLIAVLKGFSVFSVACGSGALIMLSIRYPFRRCLMPIIFAALGSLISFSDAFVTTVTTFSPLSLKIFCLLFYYFVIALSFPFALWLFAVIARRTVHNEAADFFIAALLAGLLSVLESILSAVISNLTTGMEITILPSMIFTAARGNELTLLYETLAAALILLLFKFKITNGEGERGQAA